LEAGRIRNVTLQKEGSWSAAAAWRWYRSHPTFVGVNFLPSTAVNSTAMWQSDTFDQITIERELKWAADWGYNCIRVFLPFIVWEAEPGPFLRHFDWLLECASINHIDVVPVLFDDCAFAGLEPYLGPQNPPAPLTHNSGWTPSPGVQVQFDLARIEGLKRYVSAIVGSHSRDRRVLFWDLYNEPGNNGRGAQSLYLLEASFRWARVVKPCQPITVGVWGATNDAASQDTLFNDMRAMELSDIITFHHYGDPASTQLLINGLRELGYPIVCTEWMARVHFNCRIDNVFPYYYREGIGSIHWGLVNGLTQTHIPWGWNPADGEPSVWFHDVLRPDGLPYDPQEMQIIRNREDLK